MPTITVRRKASPPASTSLASVHNKLRLLVSQPKKQGAATDKALENVFEGYSDPKTLMEMVDEMQALAHLYNRAVSVLARKSHVTPDRHTPLRKVAPTKAPSNAELLDRMQQEALAARRALVASGDVVGSEKFAEMLGVSRQALSKAVGANRMFFLEVDGQRYFPRFFADPGLDRHKLEDCCRALQDLPGGEKWTFFTLPKGSLGVVTPLEALKRGKVAEVLKAARGFAER